MVHCMVNSTFSCFENVSESQLVSDVRHSYYENVMCLEAGNEIPTNPPSGLVDCGKSYSADVDNCMRTFYEKFAANKADPDLCS